MTDHNNEIVVFDLDGTLANIEHRVHYIKGKKPRWDLFFEACVDDEPEPAIIQLAQLLYERYIIWIFSGRSDATREATTVWLLKHGVPYNFLRMRVDGDNTPDAELKARWINEHHLYPAGYADHAYCDDGHPVEMVFDDRKRVVDMWRDRFFKVLQVEPGEF
jgi:FMN phosphatase YigB (HAD superfamily)